MFCPLELVWRKSSLWKASLCLSVTLVKLSRAEYLQHLSYISHNTILPSLFLHLKCLSMWWRINTYISYCMTGNKGLLLVVRQWWAFTLKSFCPFFHFYQSEKKNRQENMIALTIYFENEEKNYKSIFIKWSITLFKEISQNLTCKYVKQ